LRNNITVTIITTTIIPPAGSHPERVQHGCW
jgi:hypothetical protein